MSGDAAVDPLPPSVLKTSSKDTGALKSALLRWRVDGKIGLRQEGHKDFQSPTDWPQTQVRAKTWSY
jgi:hypothetical protein